jgi:hypothetical protein
VNKLPPGLWIGLRGFPTGTVEGDVVAWIYNRTGVEIDLMQVSIRRLAQGAPTCGVVVCFRDEDVCGVLSWAFGEDLVEGRPIHFTPPVRSRR